MAAAHVRRRRRPPRRDGTGKHRATLSTWQLAGQAVVYTLVVGMLGTGVYAYVAQERALRGGYPPLGLPQPAPAPEAAAPLTTAPPVPPDPGYEPDEAQPDPETAAEASAPASAAPKTRAPVEPPPPEPGPILDAPTCAIANVGGDVLPHVRAVACFLDDRFPGIQDLGGRGPRALAGSDHPPGLAVDLFVGGDKGLGDAIATCAALHFDDWNLRYIIWQQAIMDGPGEPFRSMEDRGSDTANHLDHVHLSFDPDPDHAPQDMEC